MKRQLFLVSSEKYNKFVLGVTVNSAKSSRMICYVTLNKTHRYLDAALKRRKINPNKFRFIDMITPALFKMTLKKNCTFVSTRAGINKLAETIVTSVLASYFYSRLFFN